MRSVIRFCILMFVTSVASADRVDDLLRQEMKTRDIPGVVVTVIKDGKRVKTGTYGFANLEHRVPVKEATAFEIGSVTKQFTSAGIMILVQEGKLSLDDKIAVHFKNTPPHWNGVTVRQLLNHTAGIKSYTGIDKGFEVTERLTQERFIQLIGAYPLEFQPGDSYKYSNSAYSLAGYIIENVSGKNYWEFLGERIFGPAGMLNSTNREPSILIPNRAAGYEKNKQGERINRDYDLTDIFSAGAIVSTIGDMAKWELALESQRILNDSSKLEMWTPTKLNNGSSKNYGLGWNVEPLNGRRSVGHSGSTSGFSASFQRFPDDRLAVILLCNSGESGVATILAKKIAPFYFSEKNITK